ncbi:TPA: hypothetical protein I7730_15815 [Vibrio vulnificus]|uniref:Uncharacterized protein n=1 Tax=Vibrio vulnificus TaxID=672 RepID=A0A8H9N1W9_VIBVL|nr:hypothetical protein [Vibrio vulnificus]HAS8541249.1 hypothetical protein [Vibrio vulnificus]
MTTSAIINFPNGESIKLEADGYPNAVLTALNDSLYRSINASDDKRFCPVDFVPCFLDFIAEDDKELRSHISDRITEGHFAHLQYSTRWVYNISKNNSVITCVCNELYFKGTNPASPFTQSQILEGEMVHQHNERMVNIVSELNILGVTVSGITCKSTELKFLTNTVTESTNAVGKEAFDKLGLDYQGESKANFYPLTEREEKYITEDLIPICCDKLNVTTGSTALLGDQKYVVLINDVHYDEDFSKEEAFEEHKKCLKAAVKVANAQGGQVCWQSEPSYDHISNGKHTGSYELYILIPFKQIMSKYDNREDWWQSMLNEPK